MPTSRLLLACLLTATPAAWAEQAPMGDFGAELAEQAVKSATSDAVKEGLNTAHDRVKARTGEAATRDAQAIIKDSASSEATSKANQRKAVDSALEALH